MKMLLMNVSPLLLPLADAYGQEVDKAVDDMEEFDEDEEEEDGEPESEEDDEDEAKDDKDEKKDAGAAGGDLPPVPKKDEDE